MSKNNQHIIDELASIIQLLADVWPNDRENVAIAGAKFEGVIEDFDQNLGQLQKLANLSWEGIKHLYQKDDYFIESFIYVSKAKSVNILKSSTFIQCVKKTLLSKKLYS